MTWKIHECAQGLQIESETDIRIFLEDHAGSLKDFEQFDYFEMRKVISHQHQFLHLEAWSLELETKEWMKTHIEDWAQPKNCSEYFAVFADEKTTVRLAIILLSEEIFNDKRVGSSLSGTKGLWYGVILGRCEDVSKFRGDDNIFIMVIQDQGDHFERVGHMNFDPWSLRMIPEPPQPRGLHWGEWVPWQVCFRSKKRRMFRIG